MQETAPCKAPAVLDTTDYIEQHQPTPISIDTPLSLNIKTTPGGSHYSHLTLWRTTNIVGADVDYYTASETYVWLADIPMVSMLKISSVDNKDEKYSNAEITFTTQTYPKNITGLKFRSYSIDESITIEKIISYDNDKLTALVGFSDYSKFDGYNVGDTLYPEDIVENDTAKVVDIKIDITEEKGVYIVFPTGDDFPFSDLDLGTNIYTEKGDILHIIKVKDDRTVYAIDINENMPRNGFEGTAIIIDQNSLYPSVNIIYNDTTDDEVFTARRYSGQSLFFLQKRFHIHMPNAKNSALKNAIIVTSSKDSNKYQYCPVLPLYRTGYFHDGYQQHKVSEGKITRLQEYPDVIVIFGSHFTKILDMSLINNVGEQDLGESILQINSAELITNKIGVSKVVKPTRFRNNSEFILTNEPAVRLFDGKVYSDDITKHSIREKRLTKLQDKAILKWVPGRGLFLWGTVDG